MKTVFKYSLFLSLLFLFSCTLTKRKYTGGYYVNWHNKSPETRVIQQAKTARLVSNNIARSVPSSIKQGIKTDCFVPRNDAPISLLRGSAKQSPLNHYTLSNSFTYNRKPYIFSLSPPPVTNKIKRDKPAPNWDVKVAWQLCWLAYAIGGGLGLIFLVVFLVYKISSAIIPILLIIPLILFIISLIHCFMGIQPDQNRILFLCLLADIIGIAVICFLIF